MRFSLHRVILILDETWHTAFYIELLGDALCFLSIHLSSLSEDEEDDEVEENLSENVEQIKD